MKTIDTTYAFRWPDGRENLYRVALDAETLDIVDRPCAEAPPWTALDVHQCPHCPLDGATTPHCPLALQLVGINEHFTDLTSYERVAITVTTAERTISAETTAQQAISSLMGLVIPGSGCPHTRFFKPMARFHLPLATTQETIYRASSMYLLVQYFLKKAGKEADLELTGLDQIYRNLHEINIHCARRLRDAARNDSTVNAVVLLDMFAKTMPYAIEDALEEIEYLFAPYLEDCGST